MGEYVNESFQRSFSFPPDKPIYLEKRDKVLWHNVLLLSVYSIHLYNCSIMEEILSSIVMKKGLILYWYNFNGIYLDMEGYNDFRAEFNERTSDRDGGNHGISSNKNFCSMFIFIVIRHKNIIGMPKRTLNQISGIPILNDVFSVITGRNLRDDTILQLHFPLMVKQNREFRHSRNIQILPWSHWF